MRTIAIGDVHGCREELQLLLKTVDYRRGQDRCVVVGDLVDRGPDSRGVIQLCMEQGLEAIMGNHDEKHVRHARKMALSPDSRVGFKSDEERNFYTTLSPEELAWLSSLPDWLRLGPSLVAVHAGMIPGIPVERQGQRALHRCRYVEWRQDLGRYEMARMRIVETERGNGFLRPRGSIWWGEAWIGPDSVVYGHNVTTSPRWDHYPGCYTLGIDTGACFGMSLTAAIWESTDDVCSGCAGCVVEGGAPTPQLVSVQSQYSCDDDRFYEGEYDPATKEEIVP